MAKQKMYLVKREVMARNIEEAMKNDGEIYSIELADSRFQPEEKKQKPIIGFSKDKK